MTAKSTAIRKPRATTVASAASAVAVDTRAAAAAREPAAAPEPMATRERLIQAAEHCYAQRGIDATTMADIAAQAAMTRRTLYRYFATREAMLRAVVRREVERFWQGFHAVHAQRDDFAEYLLAALLYTLKHAPETQSHSFLFDQALLPLVNRIYIDNRDYIVEQAAGFGAIYARDRARADTRIRADLDMVMVCEWFNRLAVSYLAAPSPFHRSEAELRAMFRALLLPALRRDDRCGDGAAGA